jgi:hypothetical protein
MGLRRRDGCRRIRHAGDDLIEHATCVADIAESLLRIAHEAVTQQREQSGRHIRRQRFPVHVARQHCGERVRHILGFVPTLACQHFVKHDAESPDVRAAIDVFCLWPVPAPCTRLCRE